KHRRLAGCCTRHDLEYRNVAHPKKPPVPWRFFFGPGTREPEPTMHIQTDDLRIRGMTELATPEELIRERPCTDRAAATVNGSRSAVQRILHGRDDRIVVVIGPCSIHDVPAAREYAQRLARERARLNGALEVVMRVYFEKPRTTVGWKGLINDPDLDGRFRIDRGLRLARELLLDINELGVPAGCEFLDIITPQ